MYFKGKEQKANESIIKNVAEANMGRNSEHTS
jgi:hypothetical protein